VVSIDHFGSEHFLYFIVPGLLLCGLEWIPKAHTGGMQMIGRHFSWNYQTWLNLFFIPVSLIYFYWGRKSMK
jgi:hypothetical protein